MQDKLIVSIKAAARQLLPDIISIRRHLHANPELSFEEKNTSHHIQDILTKHGISFTSGWAGHGVVASIPGQQHGPLKMLRADIDALPILEANDVEYKSKNTGVMHACGHDVHTSAMLGAAIILHQHREQLSGEVKIIFQPGEEKLPGGASVMISEGVLEPPPQFIIGQHVHPPLPAGHVGFRSGLYMASADELYITVKGKGGHAATPHLCIDPILIASRIVTALQELVSRYADPMSPSVLSIGRIYSDGGATNVIPDRVMMEGTFRAMDEKWRKKAHDLIRQICTHVAASTGGEADVNIMLGYPSLINDAEVTESCRAKAAEFLGTDKVHELPQRMTSEDFAFYTHHVPGCFYRLGTGSADGSKSFPVHSNRFDIDETALETGMGLMAFLAFN